MKTEAFHLEAKLASLVKSKGGAYLKLELDPTTIPEELNNAPINQRFVIAFSPLGDFDEDLGDGARAVQLAGILCRTKGFWRFLEWHGRECSDEDYNRVRKEEDAAAALKHFTRVESRAEYRTDEAACKRFRKLHDQYEKWLNEQESRGAL